MARRDPEWIKELRAVHQHALKSHTLVPDWTVFEEFLHGIAVAIGPPQPGERLAVLLKDSSRGRNDCSGALIVLRGDNVTWFASREGRYRCAVLDPGNMTRCGRRFESVDHLRRHRVDEHDVRDLLDGDDDGS